MICVVVVSGWVAMQWWILFDVRWLLVVTMVVLGGGVMRWSHRFEGEVVMEVWLGEQGGEA